MSARGLLAAAAFAAACVAPAQAAGPSLSVSVSPTLVTIEGKGSGRIDVSNPTASTAVVDVSLGNYDITRSGRVLVDPAEPPNRTARAWLSVAPATLRLGPGAHAQVLVTSHPPKDAEPGDHHALVLLASPPGRGGQVSVVTRVGVGVLVRMPGAIRRALAVQRLTVERVHGRRVLRLRVANRGNVNEMLEPGRVTLQLWRHGRKVGSLPAPGYDLLPGESVAKPFAYRGPVRGAVEVVVVVRPTTAERDGPGITQELPPVEATFAVRL